jgi:hypothetical protein
MATTDTDPRLNLVAVSKEPGVTDLPMRVRGKFAQAIIAERKGEHVKAEQLLIEAVRLSEVV